MTATADRFRPARSREELRLVELASGLLMLMDAHRLAGHLPLEVQVQASRLRHAVKLAVQAEAARTAARPPAPSPSAAMEPAEAALRAWIATQPWVQPGPQGWVYLLCFRDPATSQHQPLVGNGCRGQYAGHYWGWTDDLIRRINQHRNPPLAWSRPPSAGRLGRRVDLRVGLAGIPGHPRSRATAQEPRLGLSPLPAMPRHRRPPRPGRRRRRRPALPAPPPPTCWKEVTHGPTHVPG
jgi:hypothetical protein